MATKKKTLADIEAERANARALLEQLDAEEQELKTAEGQARFEKVQKAISDDLAYLSDAHKAELAKLFVTAKAKKGAKKTGKKAGTTSYPYTLHNTKIAALGKISGTATAWKNSEEGKNFAKQFGKEDWFNADRPFPLSPEHEKYAEFEKALKAKPFKFAGNN